MNKKLLLAFALGLLAGPLAAEISAPPDELLALPTQPKADNPPVQEVAPPPPEAAETPAPKEEVKAPETPPPPAEATPPAAKETPPPLVIEAPPALHLPPAAQTNVNASATETVAATSLPAPSAAGYGLLDSDKGGLSAALWQDTSATAATALLEDAGTAFTRGTVNEQAWRDLARRIALTHAVEPGGATDQGIGFFAARVLLGAAAGYPDEARKMLQHNPTFLNEDGAARLAAIALMQDNIPAACADPHLQNPGVSFWQKLAVICDLSQPGGGERARLALDIMREAGESDTLFLALAEAAAGSRKQLDPKLKPTSMPVLYAALLAEGHVKPTFAMLQMLSQTPYPLLLNIAGLEAWRAGTAQNLAQGKQISASDLHSVFSGLKLKAPWLTALKANPKILGDEKKIPASLRAPYALRAVEGGNKSDILAALIALLSPEDLAGNLGALIMQSAPTPAAAGANAGIFARLALLQGAAGGKEWMAAAGKNNPGFAALYPLAVVRGAVPDGERELSLSIYAASPAVPADQRANTLAILQALGYSPGEKALANLTVLGIRLPVAANDTALNEALKSKHEGEVLLRALLLSPHDAVSVLLLQIKTLRAFGLEKEALELTLPRL